MPSVIKGTCVLDPGGEEMSMSLSAPNVRVRADGKASSRLRDYIRRIQCWWITEGMINHAWGWVREMGIWSIHVLVAYLRFLRTPSILQPCSRGPPCSSLYDMGKFVKVISPALRKIQTVGSTFWFLMLSYPGLLAVTWSI